MTAGKGCGEIKGGQNFRNVALTNRGDRWIMRAVADEKPIPIGYENFKSEFYSSSDVD